VALGFLGGERGERLRHILGEQGVETDFVDVSAPTRECVTLLDEAAGTTTELVEESRPIEAEHYHQLRQKFETRLQGAAAVVMSGTITPGGPVDLYLELVRKGNAKGILTVVDAQGAPLLRALEGSPGLVKPNRVELAATVGRTLNSPVEVIAAMRELQARGAQRVVVTAGKQTTLAFDGQHTWEITNPAIAAVNPIGSGDSFTAGVVWRLVAGDSLGEACRWGSACGAANALTIMAGEVRREDAERLLQAVKLRELNA
jgi:tagatose 6-phosphate kinase